ncbi:hypothetical protein VH569_27310 [Azospirillum sp. 11R-A]
MNRVDEGLAALAGADIAGVKQDVATGLQGASDRMQFSRTTLQAFGPISAACHVKMAFAAMADDLDRIQIGHSCHGFRHLLECFPVGIEQDDLGIGRDVFDQCRIVGNGGIDEHDGVDGWRGRGGLRGGTAAVRLRGDGLRNGIRRCRCGRVIRRSVRYRCGLAVLVGFRGRRGAGRVEHEARFQRHGEGGWFARLAGQLVSAEAFRIPRPRHVSSPPTIAIAPRS